MIGVRRRFTQLAGLMIATTMPAVAQGVITTVAGTDVALNLNGKPALTTPILSANSGVVDNSGNPVFWAGGCTLVRIGPDGILSVLAGNGICSNETTPVLGPAASTSRFLFTAPVTFDDTGSFYLPSACALLKVTAGTVSMFGACPPWRDSGNGGLLPPPDLSGVARDSAGNLYGAYIQTGRVVRFNADGTSVVVAGTGTPGFSGDGGPATSAMLNFPEAIAFDAEDNLYIGDALNNRIRKVSRDGTITTVASDANVNASGLAVVNKDLIYFVDASQRLHKFSGGASTDITPAGMAVWSVAADRTGNLLLSTSDGKLVRLSSSGEATTLAGNASLYSTDGTIATLTPINVRSIAYNDDGLAVAPDGTVYFSETALNRVRKISNGIITTIAGTGLRGLSGDGGPGVAATLNRPQQLALDPAGNLYISDAGNTRIRKLSPTGIISTFAQGFFGPLAVDATGVVYALKDYSNAGLAQIFQIDAKGNAKVAAGTGVLGYSGDGGPATGAQLSCWAMSFDPAGNLLIADIYNSKIRKVTPQGIISTVPGLSGTFPVTAVAGDRAGNIYTSVNYQGLVRISPSGEMVIWSAYGSNLNDGKLAPLVTLRRTNTGGVGQLTVDKNDNVYLIDGANQRIRVMLATPPVMAVSPQTLSFNASAGGAPVVQTLKVQGELAGLDFQVSASTKDGAAWLNVDAAAGATPRLLSITADPASLAPGTYSGTITISPAAATPATLTVSVALTVGEARPPQLSLDRPNLSFTYPRSSSARPIVATVSNAGEGVLQFTATASTNSSSNWLSVSPSTGTATPRNPVPVTVTANPAGLTPGTYTGAVTFTSDSGQQLTAPVTMTISEIAQGLLLTQTGMSFTGVSKGGVVPPQTFGVVNIGTGVLSWKASTSTLSGGAWLVATPSSGSSDATAAVPQVTVTANATDLAPGDYYGLVRIDAPGAANTPQVLTAFLQVLPEGSNPGAVVQPTELILMRRPSDISPYATPSQNLTVYNVSGSTLSYRTDRTDSPARNGLADLMVVPRVGQVDPAHPASVLVQPYYEYSGTLTFEFSDGRVQPVKVTTVIGSGDGAAAAPSKRRRSNDAGCVPTKLMPAVTTLPQAFTVSAGWPVALSVDVADDCGNPHVSGSVTVNFSNGDRALELTSLKTGTWQGTWTTATSTQSVSLVIQAANEAQKISGTREVDGALSSSKDPPKFTPAQVVSTASPVSFVPLAPGSIISIYGERLAENVDAAQAYPLPAKLGSARVIIGDKAVPLFYASQGQINAIVPFGLNLNTTHQLLIQRGLTYSRPIPIDVAPAQPAVFTYQGAAIAYAYRGTDPPFLVTQQAPARAGDVLVLYSAGLGLPVQAVDDGAASPPVPVRDSVAATVGGNPASVAYAGLLAGYAGLYQVNLTVPDGVTPGDAVPLMLTVSGQTSPIANLPIR